MSTIILYKNNRTLRLPILKFISSNKKLKEDISKKNLTKNNNLPEKKETLKITENKKFLNLSTLPDLPLNSEKYTNKNNSEKSVQTIQTCFRNSDDKLSNKNRLINIMKYVKLINKETQKRDNESSIIQKENIYKLNKKKRKKLLENYSQINHHFNNIYYKKLEKNKSKIIDITKINLNQKLTDNKKTTNRNINYINKFDLNKTQEESGKTKVKKSFSSLFHNAMLISNINKDTKLLLNREHYNNEISIHKNIYHQDNSFSNIFSKFNSQRFIKEQENKLIKGNGRFIYGRINSLKHKFFV